MNEQDLDKILEDGRELSPVPQSEKQFQQKVRKAMNRSLYGRVFLAIILVAALTAGMYFGTSGAIDFLYYRPQKEPAFLGSGQGSWENEDFTVLLEDTISTYFPGSFFWMLEPLQSHGFGHYSANLMITENYRPMFCLGPANAELQIRRSKLDLGHAPLTVFAMEFLDPEYPYSQPLEQIASAAPVGDIRQELENLPKSACVDISLSFPKSIRSQEAAGIINSRSGISVQWLALEGQNTTIYEQGAGGMFLHRLRGIEMSPEASARYPSYTLSQQVTGEELEQCLISRLQLLADHPEFLSLMESQFPEMISLSRVQQRLQNAQKNWACYGMRLMGTPEAILELMDECGVSYATINDVRVSKFAK